MKKNIIIVGAGWYGCHIALKFRKEFNITILEKNSDIFNNSSFYNQNRLHLGFHYPRNFATRNACKQYYDKFLQEYSELVDDIEANYYVLSNHSLLDYETYKSIYAHEGHDFEDVDNTFLTNIDCKLIKVKEKVINSSKAYNYFKQKLNEDVNIVFHAEVNTYLKRDDGKIEVLTKSGEMFHCDYFIDCTYNQLQLSKLDYAYELTLSLLYKRLTKDLPFDAITIMDGPFSSLYPRELDKNIYTLTDVEHTPLICKKDFNELKNVVVNETFIEEKKKLMEEKFIEYYADFLSNFAYEGYFLSHKTKLNSGSAFRDTIITEIEPNVISVNCGKIYGIFKFEDYIRLYFI